MGVFDWVMGLRMRDFGIFLCFDWFFFCHESVGISSDELSVMG